MALTQSVSFKVLKLALIVVGSHGQTTVQELSCYHEAKDDYS